MPGNTSDLRYWPERLLLPTGFDMTSSSLRAASVALFALSFVACKSDSGPKTAGAPVHIALQASTTPTGAANTILTGPVQIQVQDANGTPVPNQAVTFTVAGGGGSITSTSGTTDANGLVVLPPWRLGKSDVLQELQVMAGSTVLTPRVQVNIATQFRI